MANDYKSKAHKKWLYRKNQHAKKVKHVIYYVDENDILQIKEKDTDDENFDCNDYLPDDD